MELAANPRSIWGGFCSIPRPQQRTEVGSPAFLESPAHLGRAFGGDNTSCVFGCVSSAHIHTQAAAVQPYGACKASDVSPTIAPTLANLDLLLELGAWSNLDTCAQIPRSHPINPKTSAPLCPGARPGDAPSPRSHLEGDSTRDTAPVQPVRREQGLTRPLAAWRLGTRVTDAR